MTEEAKQDAGNLLTICIATYNRFGYLKDCVTSLLPILSPRHIPLCVSVNGASESPEVIEWLQQIKSTYANISYTYSLKNEGYDANVTRAALMAQTKYVWLMGDKIRLYPGAISQIISALESRPDIALFNCRDSPKSPPYVRNEATLLYTSPVELLRDLGWFSALLGGTVIPRAAWTPEVAAKYCGSGFAPVGVAFEFLARSPIIRAVFYGHAFLFRTGTGLGAGDYAGWHSRTFEVWTRGWKFVVDSLPSRYDMVKPPVKKSVYLNTALFSEASLLNLREHGDYNFRIYRQYRADLLEVSNTKPGLAYLIATFPFPGILKLFLHNRYSKLIVDSFPF